MNDGPSKKDQGPRINKSINATEVRVVDENGEMAGVMPTSVAITKAINVGLDLIEVSPGAKPPLCKIMEYGKYKYEQQKKEHLKRKNQKIVEVKELKIRPNIDPHDLDIKLRKATGFLEDGNKVKWTIRFRGREMAHKENAAILFDKIKETFIEEAKVEFGPKFEGRQMIMILAPITAV